MFSRPHKFLVPPMSNGVAGGAAATSKGKSGGRMAGEEKQESRQGEKREMGRRGGKGRKRKKGVRKSDICNSYTDLFLLVCERFILEKQIR